MKSKTVRSYTLPNIVLENAWWSLTIKECDHRVVVYIYKNRMIAKIIYRKILPLAFAHDPETK